MKEIKIQIPKVEYCTITNINKVALFAVYISLCLAFIKFILFYLTGSYIIALSALDSLSDAGISLVNKFVIKYARKDFDDTHPYGRGKAENLASLAQSAWISAGVIGIIIVSIKNIFNNNTVNMSYHFILFFIISSLISFFVSRKLKHAGEKCNSPALIADSEHYKSDVFVNLGSGLGILLVIFIKYSFIDSLIAIIFAIFTAINALTLFKLSLQELMDKDISDDIKKEALEIIMSCSEHIVDIHNFRGRKSGHRIFFDFHMTLNTHLSFMDVHSIVEKVENKLKYIYKGDVIIHSDPDTLPIEPLEKIYATRRH